MRWAHARASITGEDDVADKGTALRHVAELDAQAPVLDDGRDQALADLPALVPFLTAKPLSGGPSTCWSWRIRMPSSLARE